MVGCPTEDPTVCLGVTGPMQKSTKRLGQKLDRESPRTHGRRRTWGDVCVSGGGEVDLRGLWA